MRFAFPIVALFVAILSGQLAGPAQPAAQSPIVEYLDDAKSTSTGPGFKPAPPATSTCQCGDFAALEKRVAALESKIASYGSARPATTTASQGSVGGSGQVAVSRPVTTSGLPYGSVVISERVVSSRPTVTYQTSPAVTTTTRTGLFGRQITRSVAAPQTCRIVNGVRICN
jgi:hypothetical protein